MNSGKSSLLIQTIHNYRERGMNVLVFTPSITNKTEISSRIGATCQAISFLPCYDFTQCEKSLTRCILIDEAQFLTYKQVEQLCKMVDIHNIPVLCYGLRTDFKGHLFEGSQALLALADELKEVKTICKCGQKATMNCKTTGSKNEIIDLDKNRYISLCRACFANTNSL